MYYYLKLQSDMKVLLFNIMLCVFEQILYAQHEFGTMSWSPGFYPSDSRYI